MVANKAKKKLCYIQNLHSGLIKIGMSVNPVQYMLNHQSEARREFKLLACHLPDPLEKNGPWYRFRHLEIKKFWFLPKPELLEYIASIPFHNFDPHIYGQRGWHKKWSEEQEAVNGTVAINP